jgi:hypothetical protein
MKFKSEYELYSFLNNCGYGMVVNGNRVSITDSTTPNELKSYRTLSPKDFEKYRIGVCWDYCAYTDHILRTQLHIPCTMYYIEVCPPASDTHSFVIYRKDGEFYKLESSFLSFRGIEAFNTEKEILDLYINKVARGRPYAMFKFDPTNKYGETTKEYMDSKWEKKNFIKTNMSNKGFIDVFGIDIDKL